MVVNFIPLNRIAIKDHYPIPRVDDLFNSIGDMKYFCALDCTEGFHQIQILEEHKERTAFIAPHGMFQYKRVPFGFTNSPAKFQTTRNEIFKEGLYKRCVVYIDDILVFSKTKEIAFENLDWVFEKCKQFDIKIKLSKCSFMTSEVDFLGHKIKLNSTSPIPDKNDLLLTKTPSDKTDVMSILGALNYYSRFIHNFTEKTLLLRQLTKNIPFM